MSQPVENMALAEWLQEAPPDITRALQGDFNLSYGLGAQFPESMYLDRAIGEMAERWEGDVYAAYQMLLFNRVSSARVATLLALTIPNILQNQEVSSALYLAHLYQLHSAQQNVCQAFIQSNPTKSLSKKRQIKKTPNRVSQPVAHGVKMPLERFFSQYSKFKYRPTISPVIEFRRLCEEYGWEKSGRKKKAARDEFDHAMKKEFDALYGADEKDINNWYKLCHVLRIDPIPDTLKKCRAAVCRKHVNLVDLVEGSRENIQIFKSEKELSEYTQANEKYFPRKSAADGGVLRALRRQIFEPRDDF